MSRHHICNNFICLIAMLTILTACGNQNVRYDAEGNRIISLGNTEHNQNTISENHTSVIEQVDCLLQGTWAYYDSEVGFGEVFTFDNGSVMYTSYLDAARDKDHSSISNYNITDSAIIISGSRDTCYDYSLENGTLIISYCPSGGIDQGIPRYYQKIDTSISHSEYVLSLPSSTGGELTSTENISSGKKNALQSAYSYLNSLPFSYSGLIKQLEYEGYSTIEATYAADNCGADWYEQAVKSAKSYLNAMSFSRSGLIDQLQYEGFTYDQAVYGVEQTY